MIAFEQILTPIDLENSHLAAASYHLGLGSIDDDLDQRWISAG